jgi:hypothetical protein
VGQLGPIEYQKFRSQKFATIQSSYKSIDSLDASTADTFSSQTSDVSSERVTSDDQTIEVDQERVLVQEIDETSDDCGDFWDTVSGSHVVDAGENFYSVWCDFYRNNLHLRVGSNSPINSTDNENVIYKWIFLILSLNLHNIVVSTSQVSTGDVNVDWWLMVVVESVDDESGTSSIRVPVGVSHVGSVEAQSLTGCWVSASEKHEEHVVVSVESRLGFQFDWVQVHQVHATFIVGNQSPAMIWIVAWCGVGCGKVSSNFASLSLSIKYSPPANNKTLSTMKVFILIPFCPNRTFQENWKIFVFEIGFYTKISFRYTQCPRGAKNKTFYEWNLLCWW